MDVQEMFDEHLLKFHRIHDTTFPVSLCFQNNVPGKVGLLIEHRLVKTCMHLAGSVCYRLLSTA